MPLLRFRAIESKKIVSISRDLIDELQLLIGCPRDYFALEAIESVFIKDGKVVSGYPIVEVSWFDRGQEVQDNVAKIITNYVYSMGYDDADIIFIPLEECKYYENGEHF